MQSLGVFSPADRVDDAILVTAVQGAFYGSALPAAQIEALIAAHVPKKEIVEVADVYDSKWWDYRRLAPGHSFFLFAHHYYRSAQIAARKVVSERPNERGPTADKRRAYAMVGPALVQMDAAGIWERDSAHITGMWKAMLTCDAFGIPYGEFCRLSCRVAIDRLWKRIPRPSQLYSDKLAAYVVDEWEQLGAGRFFTATHPLYSVEHYAGLEVQDRYRAWLIEQIQRQDNPVTALMTCVYSRPQLPESEARTHFSDHLLNRARLLAA